MEAKLIEKTPTFVRYALSGDLRDSRDPALDAVVAGATTPRAIIDLGAIELVNSVGVAAWSDFTRRLASRGRAEFERVPAIFLHFASQTGDVFSGGILTSLLLPFVCESCRLSALLEFMASDVAKSHTFGEPRCMKCNRGMLPEFDPEDFLMTVERAARG